MLKQICSKCKKEYEVIDLEIKIRSDINAPLPICCPQCRIKERYNKLPDYGFKKVKCVFCGEETFSANNYVNRPTACNTCYRNKFLQEIN